MIPLNQRDIFTQDSIFAQDISQGRANQNVPSSRLRADGTLKGQGWLGVLNRSNGDVSTEITIGVNIGGKEIDIPTLVPTLNKYEINYLLSTDPSPEMWKTPIGRQIIDKAYDHAVDRISRGMSPFAD